MPFLRKIPFLFMGYVFTLLSAQAQSELPTSLPAGLWDAHIDYVATRGSFTPGEDKAFQQEASIDGYRFRLGRNLGDAGPLSELSLFAGATLYHASAETLRGTTYHPADSGNIFSLGLASTISRSESAHFGASLSFSDALDYDVQKVSIPRVDQISGALSVEADLSLSWSLQAQNYWGWGYDRHGGSQNAVTALSTSVARNWKSGFLPYPARLWVGPYFESDLTRRNDPIYGTRTYTSKLAIALRGEAGISSELTLDAGVLIDVAGHDSRGSLEISTGLQWRPGA